MLAVVCACGDDAPAAPPVDPNDLDGDGIPNELDLCPHTSDPIQHDEDGDRLGDRCDICPTVADPLQADTTELDALQFEDHVGDACDPQPSRGGTKIGALHTFATDASSGWLGTGWTIAGDLARASGTAMWQARTTTPGGSVIAVARFSTVTWIADGELSLLLDGDGVSAGMRCAVTQDRDGDGSDELVVEEVGSGVDPQITSLDRSIQPDDPLVLTLSRTVNAADQGVLDCKVDHAGVTRSGRLTTADNSVAGQYAFGSAGAMSEVTSLIVYTGPQRCPDPGLRACPE